MSAENESKPDATRAGQNDDASSQQPIQSEEHHALSAQAQRDEEIAAIQQHAAAPATGHPEAARASARARE